MLAYLFSIWIPNFVDPAREDAREDICRLDFLDAEAPMLGESVPGNGEFLGLALCLLTVGDDAFRGLLLTDNRDVDLEICSIGELTLAEPWRDLGDVIIGEIRVADLAD